MSKSKKKRDKKYTGRDAKPTQNLVKVHRVNAVVRSNWRQWIHERRKMLKRTTIIVVIVAAVIFLIVQAVMAIRG
jgi:CHASE3 domain sensor protein